MQSTLVDVTSYLQLCFAELPDYCVAIQAESKLTSRSAFLTAGLPILFF